MLLHAMTRRWQSMTTLYPLFRRQAFQVQPHRMGRTLRHGGNIAGRNVAGKKFDDDIGNLFRRKQTILVTPMAHSNAGSLLRFQDHINFRANTPEADQIVDPQRDSDAMLALQLPRQSPAYADIAVVIDDFAKDSQRWRMLIGQWHGVRHPRISVMKRRKTKKPHCDQAAFLLAVSAGLASPRGFEPLYSP